MQVRCSGCTFCNGVTTTCSPYLCRLYKSCATYLFDRNVGNYVDLLYWSDFVLPCLKWYFWIFVVLHCTKNWFIWWFDRWRFVGFEYLYRIDITNNEKNVPTYDCSLRCYLDFVMLELALKSSNSYVALTAASNCASLQRYIRCCGLEITSTCSREN